MILQPLLIQRTKVLDFSPPRCLYTKLKNTSSIEYTASDFSGEFVADERLDITGLKIPDASFDIIICYHILEHIENDVQALGELFRVVKPGGCCLVQTPFRKGDIYEDYSIINPTDRKEHFGQEDHIRIYSVPGLIKRLTSVGFIVEQANYLEPKNNYYGFHEQETILIATK